MVFVFRRFIEWIVRHIPPKSNSQMTSHTPMHAWLRSSTSWEGLVQFFEFTSSNVWCLWSFGLKTHSIMAYIFKGSHELTSFFPLNVLNHAYLGMAGGRGQARLPIMHSSHTQSSSIYKHTHTHTLSHTHTHTQRFEHTTLLSLAWKETRNFYETKQANTFLFVLKKKISEEI
jgi:hypothetical protein